MHMDGTYMDADGLETMLGDSTTGIVSSQHTNNLDGLLRDAQDNVITLGPCDFRHQAHIGGECREIQSGFEPVRYVFRQGRLIKIPPVTEELNFSET